MTRSCAPLLCAALLAGCAAVGGKTVTFDVLRPAAYTLPAWVDTVLIVDGAVSPVVVDSTVPPADMADAAEGRADWLCSELCRTMAATINRSGYVVAKAVNAPTATDWSVTRTVYGEAYADALYARRALTMGRIDSLLRGTRKTIILNLTELRSVSTIEATNAVVNGETQICGDIVAATTTRMELVSSADSRFPMEARHDTLHFTACDPDPHNVANLLPPLHTRYTEQAGNVGRLHADAFIPEWQTVRRSLYVTNASDMLAAAAWVDKGEWTEATNLWNRVATESASLPDRVRAMLNMALSYEREDDPARASMWCSKALDAIESAPAKEAQKLTDEKARADAMFAYLLHRAGQKETLDAQMQ